MYCPYCQAEIPDKATLCPRCQRPIDANGRRVPRDSASSDVLDDRTYKTCPYCGEHLTASSEYCTKCGRSLVDGRRVDDDGRTGVGGGDVPVSPPSSQRMLVVLSVVCAVAAVALIALLLSGGGDGKGGGGELTTGGESTSEDSTEPGQEQPGKVVEKEDPSPVFDLEPSASSERPAEDGMPDHYAAKNVLDKDPTSAWTEYEDGTGAGSWLRLRASSPQKLRGIRMIPGHANGPGIFSCNCRPKDVTVTLSDGYSIPWRLDDLEVGTWQEIEFDDVHEASSVTITIDSVYTGVVFDGIGPFDDCCISEVEAF